MAPSVVSMSTLYVLSLRTEEDLVDADGYVAGGLATEQARLPGQVGSEEEPWRLYPLRGFTPGSQAVRSTSGWIGGVSRRAGSCSRSLTTMVSFCPCAVFLLVTSWVSESQGPGWNGGGEGERGWGRIWALPTVTPILRGHL